MLRGELIVAVGCLGLLGGTAAGDGPPATATPVKPVFVVAPVPIPGGEGGLGFDDLQYAPSLERFLVPAGRTGTLCLVEPESLAVTPIGGFAVPSGIEGRHFVGTTSADAGAGLLFAIDRSGPTLDVVDPEVGKIVATAALAGPPDFVRYVAPTSELWVTEPHSGQIELFSRPAGKDAAPAHTALISIPDGPESLVIDAARGRAYTNLEDRGQTVAVDLKARAVVETWSPGCETATGLALDAERGLLLVACREGAVVSVDVVHQGKVLGRAATGSGVDIIAFSPALRHAYAPARDGSLTVVAVSRDGTLAVLGAAELGAPSHCVAADDRGNVIACDPTHGRLLRVKDPFPPTR